MYDQKIYEAQAGGITYQMLDCFLDAFQTQAQRIDAQAIMTRCLVSRISISRSTKSTALINEVFRLCGVLKIAFCEHTIDELEDVCILYRVRECSNINIKLNKYGFANLKIDNITTFKLQIRESSGYQTLSFRQLLEQRIVPNNMKSIHSQVRVKDTRSRAEDINHKTDHNGDIDLYGKEYVPLIEAHKVPTAPPLAMQELNISELLLGATNNILNRDNCVISLFEFALR